MSLEKIEKSNLIKVDNKVYNQIKLGKDEIAFRITHYKSKGSAVRILLKPEAAEKISKNERVSLYVDVETNKIYLVGNPQGLKITKTAPDSCKGAARRISSVSAFKTLRKHGFNLINCDIPELHALRYDCDLEAYYFNIYRY